MKIVLSIFLTRALPLHRGALKPSLFFSLINLTKDEKLGNYPADSLLADNYSMANDVLSGADYRILEEGVFEHGIDEGVRIPFIPSMSDITHPLFSRCQTGRECVHPRCVIHLSLSLSLVPCFFVIFKFASPAIVCAPRELISFFIVGVMVAPEDPTRGDHSRETKRVFFGVVIP